MAGAHKQREGVSGETGSICSLEQMMARPTRACWRIPSPCMAVVFWMEPLDTVRAAKVFLACFRPATGRTATGAMAAMVHAIFAKRG